MLDKKDAQWWVLEAQKHPESAVDLIKMLADRLALLDKQNEELRSELITLRRKQNTHAASPEIITLQQRIQELTLALHEGKTQQRLVIYGANRIEVNMSLDAAVEQGLTRQIPADVNILHCDAMAKLLILTAESQAFSVEFDELPVPTDGAALLGNPNNVAAIIDQATFDTHRFLTLLTRGGYVYSMLIGTVVQYAKRREKLIRHLIPDDPIMAVVPSYNADLLVVSSRGRWTRFAEKTITGAGSLSMELSKGDSLIGLLALNQETSLIAISTDGQLFLRPTDELKARRGPGAASGTLIKGKTLLGVTIGSEITVLTRLGKILTLKIGQLPFTAQTETGIPVPGLSPNDSVITFTAR